jgi:hypothetical protein
LSTTLKLNGIQRKIGFIDANCNFQFDDSAIFQMQEGKAGESWKLTVGDVMRQEGIAQPVYGSDSDNSPPFLNLMYFGGEPFKISFNRNMTSVNLEPYTRTLPSLTISNSSAIAGLILAHKTAEDAWDGLSPEIKRGKIDLPTGIYHLYECRLNAKLRDGSVLKSTGRCRLFNNPVEARAGASAMLQCGAPLELRVKHEAISDPLLNSLKLLQPLPATHLRIYARVYGSGGEMYGKFGRIQPDSTVASTLTPQFHILNKWGGEVDFGTLEYAEDGLFQATWKIPSHMYGKNATLKVSFNLGPLGPAGKPLASAPISIQL